MSFAALPHTIQLPLLLLHPILGFGIGRLYFYGVWNSVLLIQASMLAALSWTVLRLALLAVVLAGIAAVEGALPLLLTTLGFLAARHFALRAAS
ncbi:MAG: hypothetical protein JSR78_02660 [Proteobacteria bacterium]|nr:hypothetical protein [Pseudomonadota bacterium]